MPNATSVEGWVGGASASFYGVLSIGFLPVLLVVSFLLLLTSERFFRYLSPILGRFATWVKRVLEGYVVYSLFHLLYELGSSAAKHVTLQDLIHCGKWGVVFTAIGYASVWTRDRILENAGIELPTLREAVTEEAAT